jgi:hypothetical protein
MSYIQKNNFAQNVFRLIAIAILSIFGIIVVLDNFIGIRNWLFLLLFVLYTDSVMTLYRKGNKKILKKNFNKVFVGGAIMMLLIWISIFVYMSVTSADIFYIIGLFLIGGFIFLTHLLLWKRIKKNA